MTSKQPYRLDEESTALLFFSGGHIQWKRSADEVWKEILAETEKRPSRVLPVFLSPIKFAATAFLVVALASAALLFFYRKTMEALPGERVSVFLPDGSEISLNSGSSVSYYPLKWFFERKVFFDGEGFFSVQKGKKFRVVSEKATTEVLGTSFNIFSRDEIYRVTCFTGKVRLDSHSAESVVLLPGSHAELGTKGFIVDKNVNPENVLGWKNNRFYFEGNPLKEVVDEIERQYAVTIHLDKKLYDRSFAGNFTRNNHVEEILNWICKTMQAEFEKQSDTVYLLKDKG